MNNLIYVFLIIITFSSCKLKTYELRDSNIRVPKNNSVFVNKMKFNSKLYSSIDTNVIYEEYLTNYKKLARLDNHSETVFYGAYRFYSDGRVSYFIIDRNNPVTPNNFNPIITGYRGVYYEDKGILKIDLFAEISQRGNFGVSTHSASINKDTLFVKRKYGNIDVYVRKSLPNNFLKYQADW